MRLDAEKCQLLWHPDMYMHSFLHPHPGLVAPDGFLSGTGNEYVYQLVTTIALE